MNKQILSEEFQRMQKLAGIITESQLNENEEVNLLQFIEDNKNEIAKELEAIRLEDIEKDDMGDIGALAIYDDDGDEMESGISFRYAKDGNKNFTGEDGAEPRTINVAGKELMYIEYNI